MDVTPVLSLLPPWLALAALVGAMNGAACFILVGRRLGSLPWYVVIGSLAGGLGQIFAQALGAPVPLAIGELNVVAASVAALLVLVGARIAGL
jgi:hypothetical protein